MQLPIQILVSFKIAIKEYLNKISVEFILKAIQIFSMASWWNNGKKKIMVILSKFNVLCLASFLLIKINLVL